MEEEILSFIVINDFHLGGHGEGQYHNRLLYDHAEEIATIAIEMINDLSPTFVVVCGDITNRGERKSIEKAHVILDRLQSPYYILTGNHDTNTPGGRQSIFEIFPEQFPQGRPYRSFSHGEFTFIILEAYWQRDDGDLSEDRDDEGGYGRMAIPPDQVEWLKEVLASNSDKRCFLFTHHPLVAMAPDLQEEGRKEGSRLENSDCLLNLIADHPNLRACFAGHQHYHQITERDGIVHCTIGSMIEYPMAFRKVVLFPDRFEIHYIPFRDQGYPKKSLIDQDWVAGRPEERDQIFPF